jgi:hypothetical protein
MRALAFVCTLNSSPAPSSSHLIADQVRAEFESLGVSGEVVRVADHDIRPGVGLDMGDGDAWPALRQRVGKRGRRPQGELRPVPGPQRPGLLRAAPPLSVQPAATVR